MTSSASDRKMLIKIATNCLQKELTECQVNPPAGFKHRVTDNLQRWVIEVIGASGTVYANENYQFQVDFPEHYPMESSHVNIYVTHYKNRGGMNLRDGKNASGRKPTGVLASGIAFAVQIWCIGRRGLVFVAVYHISTFLTL